MPELPEVETVRRQLDVVLPDRRIVRVEVLRGKSFVGEPTKVVGKKITGVHRRAKILRIALEDGLNLLVHLKMTGQLIYQNLEARIKNKEDKNHKNSNTTQVIDRIVGGHPLRLRSGQASNFYNRIVGGHPTIDWIQDLPSKHTRVILTLNNGILYFNDQRVFGWVKVVKDSDLEREHINFGPDIINTERVTEAYFYKQLLRSRAAIKLIILDQKRFAGVGNIYANDGLWGARISPLKPSNQLSKAEAKRLLAALRKVMHKGIELGGASETNFMHINGMGGSYQDHFLTYKREGKVCLRKGCGGVMQKISLGGRGTYFCPKCQK